MSNPKRTREEIRQAIKKTKMSKKHIKEEIDSILSNLENNNLIHNRKVGATVRSIFFRNGNPNNKLSNISIKPAQNILVELKELMVKLNKDDSNSRTYLSIMY